MAAAASAYTNNFAKEVSGENGPHVAHIDNLGQLDILQKMSDPARRTGIYGSMITEEMRYTDAAAICLSKDKKICQDVGGNNVESAKALGLYMQMLQTRQATEDTISQYLPDRREGVAKRPLFASSGSSK